jgi:hypothetical protein
MCCLSDTITFYALANLQITNLCISTPHTLGLFKTQRANHPVWNDMPPAVEPLVPRDRQPPTLSPTKKSKSTPEFI